MTVVAPANAMEFVAGARPMAPARLVARVSEVLASDPRAASLPAAEGLLAAADRLLDAVLADGVGPARDRALDLLAADACVTWAFEAAADDPSTLAGRARQTMDRLARRIA